MARKVMGFAKIITATVLVIIAPLCNAQGFCGNGKFSGSIETEWLGDGRKMRLLKPLIYFDPKCAQWYAPTNSIIDGASIPRFAWSIIGGPYEGKYRAASIVHDVACEQKTRPWEAVHEMFYWAMLASGVEVLKAKVMYGAVYHFGPRWSYLLVETARIEEANAAVERIRRQVPDSTVETLAVRGTGIPPGPGAAGPMVDIDMEVRPQPALTREADFEKLKQLIEARELSASGGLSLEEIRRLKPK
jgi:hypothetical protein